MCDNKTTTNTTTSIPTIVTSKELEEAANAYNLKKKNEARDAIVLLIAYESQNALEDAKCKGRYKPLKISIPTEVYSDANIKEDDWLSKLLKEYGYTITSIGEDIWHENHMAVHLM